MQDFYLQVFLHGSIEGSEYLLQKRTNTECGADNAGLFRDGLIEFLNMTVTKTT